LRRLIGRRRVVFPKGLQKTIPHRQSGSKMINRLTK
jgi:hypothetical protein